jgi:CheY-like chemotaxis protein
MMNAMSGNVAQTTDRGSRATVLLVEDEQLVLNVLKASLERLGYRVLPC